MRWLLVVPGAMLSYLAISLVVGILSEIAGSEFGTLRGASPELRNLLSQAVNSIAAPVAFVYAGSVIAPSHRFPVSLVLASVFVFMTIPLLAYGVYAGAHVPLSASRTLGTWWLVVCGVMSIAAATATPVVLYQRERKSL